MTKDNSILTRRKLHEKGFVNAKVLVGSGWAEGVEFHGSNPLALLGSPPQGGRRRVSGGVPTAGASEESNREENRKRAVRRARTTLRRKAKELYGRRGGKVYFLTLTYAENMQEYEQALKDIRSFFLKLRRRVRGKYNYIAVPERQERGAWHWHILIDLHLDHKEWERLWGHGFVWIERVRSPRQAARYVGKYIAKAVEDVSAGRHRYLTSQGIGWMVEYVVARDKAGSWYGFRHRDRYVILGVADIDGNVFWWEAFHEELCVRYGMGCF